MTPTHSDAIDELEMIRDCAEHMLDLFNATDGSDEAMVQYVPAIASSAMRMSDAMRVMYEWQKAFSTRMLEKRRN